LLRPAPEARPDRPIHDRLREVLQARGASFFPQLLAAARGGFAPELGDALWDLVWAGEVTNDSFHAVRALLAPVRRSRRTNSVGRAMHVRSLERFTVRDDVAGRWSLTDAAGDAPITPTERATAQIRQLLERHGVLTREIVRSRARAAPHIRRRRGGRRANTQSARDRARGGGRSRSQEHALHPIGRRRAGG